MLAVNKWDGLIRIKNDIKRELDRRLRFVDFARCHFISALHGTGVGHLLNRYELAGNKRINTAMLTQIMEMAQDDHQYPWCTVDVKMKYAREGNPPW